LEERVKNTVVKLLELASSRLPDDVINALREAYEQEESNVAKIQLDNMLRNARLAEERNLPICQDTGLVVFFVDLGRKFPIELDLPAILNEATKEATERIPLRPNAVHPIDRTNSGDNLGVGVPIINWNITENDYLEITAMPKGGGSENMSKLRVLNPGAGVEGIREFLVDTVKRAGGKPCPPTIIGLGIGGTTDETMKLAKKATLRPLDREHQEASLAALERSLLEEVNDTGIGPMGLGGKTTALGVKVEYAYCHTASLPAGINVQCWAARRATARILKGGGVELLSHSGVERWLDQA